MAYKKEEIIAALSDPRYAQFGVNLPLLEQSVNYPLIMDFLTGKSNALQGLAPFDNLHYWNALAALLEDVTTIGKKEKLLFELAADPVVGIYLVYNVRNWLLNYLLSSNSNKAFQEGMQELRKLFQSNDELFLYILQFVRFESDGDFDIPAVPLFEFLGDYIEKMPAMPVPAQGQFFVSDKWNPGYFVLLDKYRPEFAKDYALTGIKAADDEALSFLSVFRQGKYLPIAEQFISTESAQRPTTVRRFQVATRFYEMEPAKSEYLVPLAKKILDVSNLPQITDPYEHGMHLKEFAGTSLSYLDATAVALHFLLKLDKKLALEYIESYTQQKKHIGIHSLKIIAHHLREDAWPYIEKIIENDDQKGGIDYFRSALAVIEAYFSPAVYLPLVWKLASSKQKSIRELVAKIISVNDKDAGQKAIALLDSKNAESRITAALILGQAPSPAGKEAVIAVLSKETNDNARDLLLQIAAESLPREVDLNFVSAMVDGAQKRGKLNKPVEAWLNESELPPLYFKNGETLPPHYVRFLLYRISRGKEMRSDIEARYLVQHLDKEKSSPFAFELISIYKSKGAKPEHKYLMLLAALLGNDDVIDKIRLTINKWIEENRTKMAEYGIAALSLQGGDKALRWVEWYSRKYRSNKAKLGAAALAALENAAEELGISTHELGDRIVPNFDFDGLFKHFTVNGDEYRAFIDSNFKIAFFNEDNKKIKSVPAAADAALKEELKAIAKEVRDIVKSQSPRLEYYLIIQRRWAFERWRQFFLQNPIMFIYATKLLWGVYDADGKIVQTFLCNDDTTLVDVNHDEISPDETKMIGIVHPSQLSAEQLQQWKQVFFDNSIEPIFPQLERAVPDMNGIDLSKKMISKFSGKRMKEGSTRSTLERYGWYRGPVGDGGMLESINLKYPEKKLEAVLEVSGIGAGYGWGGEDTLGRFYVMDTSTGVKQQYTHFKEEDERLVTLESVPGIFLREALAAIEAIRPLEKIT